MSLHLWWFNRRTFGSGGVFHVFRVLINIFVLDTLQIPSGCIHIYRGCIATLAAPWLRAWLEDTSLLECYDVSLGK
jgi:hypothetical protein